MAQITIMMAAYNAGKYLRRALDSVRSQTFQDFDLIITDDGSRDDTLEIAREYAAMDSRIHVIHQENAGVCITRNNCLDWAYAHSDSQWVIFWDSDDWAHPEMLQRMLDAAVEKGVKIVACGYAETTGDDPVIAPETLEPVVWDTMDFYRKHYVNAIMTCCKLYHKSCYQDIRHPTDNYFDDEFVSYRMLYAEKQMAVIPAPLYSYFINDTGLTKRKWTPKMLDAWVAYEEQIRFFTEKGEQELANFRYRGYLENALTNYQAAQDADNTEENQQARRRIRKKIREVLHRMHERKALSYQFDMDVLLEFYPVRMRLYRLTRELREGFGRKKNA